MAEGKEERRLDRLSELPNNVIDHIMSFLNEEDIVATAVSSKTWRRVRSKHPVLNLDESTFIGHRKHRYRSKNDLQAIFIVFVFHTLQRFLQSKLHLQKFSLSIDSVDFFIYNDWILFALNNNVAELELCFSNSHIYFLPKILFSSKLLTVLHLGGCKLCDQNFSDKIKCESLRELKLHEVHISENVIQCLINSFPSIINLVLKWCNGVKNLNLSNLNKLNIVEVHTNSDNEHRCCKIDSIHIEALSLRFFKFFGKHHKCHINLDGCRNLEVLHIDQLDLQYLFWQNLSSNFPLLRTLLLCKCDNLGRIRIASQCLESLTLTYVEGIVDATIDTPNLRSFEYNGDLDKLFLFSIYTPRLCDATIIQFKSSLNTALFFSKLRAIIGKLSPNRILSLSISSKATFKLSGLKNFQIPQLCHVKHLKLDLHSISSTYIGLVNGILWSCHPETLSMITNHEANNDFIKALYDELWDTRMMWNCCKSGGIKCWRHDLKDFEIEGFSGTSYKKTLAQKRNISFKFKW